MASFFVSHWKAETERLREELAQLKADVAKAEKHLKRCEAALSRATTLGQPTVPRLTKEFKAAKQTWNSTNGKCRSTETQLARVEKNSPPDLEPLRRLLVAADLNPDSYTRPDQIDGSLMKDIEARLQEKERRAEAARKAEEEHEENGLVLLRKTVKGLPTGEFRYQVTGIVENRTDKKVHALIIFNIYDSHENRIGTAMDVIDNLDPGDRWKFSAVAFVSEGASQKLAVLKRKARD